MRQKIQVKCLFTLLLLAFSTMAQAETPVVEWIRQLGTTSYDGGFGVSVDGSGNAYVTGYTYGSLDGNTNAGSYDIFLTKYDTDGTKLWVEQLGSISDDRSVGMSVDGSGNAYVTGWTHGSLDGNPNAGNYDMFLTKYDTDGTKLWTEQLGSAGYDSGTDVSVDDSGNVYVTGWTNGSLAGNTSAGGIDLLLAKYDKNGSKLWTKQLGSTSDDKGCGVSVDDSGNAYITGYTYGSLDGNTNAGYADMFLAKFDTDGNKLWIEQLGTDSYDNGNDISVDDSGNAYVTGITYGSLDSNTNAGSADLFLTKYDTNGIKLWTEQLGSAGDDYGSGVSVDGSGNAYVTGRTLDSLDGNTNEGSYDILLVKYDTNGTKLWTEQLGSAGFDSGSDVSVDDSGNAYITGYTTGSLNGNPNAGGYDMFLMKITTAIPGDANGDGCVDGSDVTILAGNWQYGVGGAGGATWAMGDFNGDGQVDGSDVTILADNWQAGVTATTVSIPEPGSVVMLAGIAFMALLCRRRKSV